MCGGLLKNKSFDDSEKARKEILDLYKNLRVTDVLDNHRNLKGVKTMFTQAAAR